MKKLTSLLIALLMLFGSISANAETANASDAASAEQQSRTLVVYYSATGTTQAIAEQIAALTGADIFSLEPVTPYTDEDLNWRDRESRVVKEHEAGEKPVELVSVEVEGWDNYDTVYIGYPIWWQDASWVMDAFVEGNDFTGKTVIPFCTSRPPVTGRAARTWQKKPAPAIGSMAVTSMAQRQKKRSPTG